MVRVVLAQTAPVWGDPRESVCRSMALLEGSPEGTRLAVLPELWTCSYDNPAMERHAAQSPDALKALGAWGRSRGSWVLAGSVPWLSDGGLTNRSWLLNDVGGAVASYDKVHLFPLLEEHRIFRAGDTPLFFDLDGISFACAICYDLRFPEYIRALTLRGVHALVVVAEWPESRLLAWRTLVQARAIENELYVLACNRCGEGGGERWGGHSLAVAPDGTILTEGGDDELLLSVTLHRGEVEAMRRRLPVLAHRRRDLYGAVTAL